MPKELKAGISFSDDTAQTVVLELHPEEVVLHYLEEFKNASRSDIWFLDSIINARKGFSGKISSVSVALDNSAVFLHSFPLDTSLTQTEQNEYVQWELSNFIEDFKPREYINDIHPLRTRARDQVSDVLAVSVKRTLLFDVQQALADQHIDLRLADTYYFGTQYSLLATYPEVKTKTVALVGATMGRLDVGILVNGRLIDYRYKFVSTIEESVNFLREVLMNFPVSDIYLYGTAMTLDLTKNLHTAFAMNVTALNPFRRMRISSSFRDFDKFIGQEHRFASCVGCVLKKQ